MQEKILTILDQSDTHNLPAIPAVLVELLETFQSPNFSFDDLTKIINKDPSLSTKVLAAANSSFYGQRAGIQNLNRVLVVLGLDNIKKIAMTSVVQQFFNQIVPSSQKFLDVIFYRALTCAHFARRLAELTGYAYPDEAYITGLLHRLGQLILMQTLPKEYPELLSEHSVDLANQIERNAIGACHSEIGAHIIRQWQLQSFIADAVLLQNKTFEIVLDSPQLVKIINLAAQLSQFESRQKDSAYLNAFNLFSLSEQLLDDLLKEIKKEVEKLAGSLSIVIDDSKTKKSASKNILNQQAAIRSKMGHFAKDIAMMGALGQSKEFSAKLVQTIALIQKDLGIVFGLNQTMLFLVNPELYCLEACYIGDDEDEQKLWSSLSIQLLENRSILVYALSSNRTLNTFGENRLKPQAVNDKLIIRLLGAEGFAAVPLVVDGEKLGVIVVGMPASELPKFKAKHGLVSLFAAESARSLVHHYHSLQQLEDGIGAVRTDYEMQAQKVIHEVANPLSIINNYLFLLSSQLDDQQLGELKIIQDEIDRVGNLILSLSDTFEDLEAEQSSADVNLVITDLIKLFEAGALPSHNVTIESTLDKSIPVINVNKSKLKQILTNLLKNSGEAMPSGGKITINSKDNVFWGNKNYVEIQISDNGPGLSDEVKSRLFEPVKSTKGPHHAGLGLTIVKNLIDELSGLISCSSEKGEGTTFVIFLPRKTQD